MTGTKLGCGEGGCGACTVMVSSWEGDSILHRAVNACLCPLYAVEGMHVVTVEGACCARLCPWTLDSCVHANTGNLDGAAVMQRPAWRMHTQALPLHACSCQRRGAREGELLTEVCWALPRRHRQCARGAAPCAGAPGKRAWLPVRLLHSRLRHVHVCAAALQGAGAQ